MRPDVTSLQVMLLQALGCALRARRRRLTVRGFDRIAMATVESARDWRDLSATRPPKEQSNAPAA